MKLLVLVSAAIFADATAQQNPRIATDNGDIILSTGRDGRIGYRSGDSQTEYLNETTTKAIDAAANMIRVGFEMGQALNLQAQLGEAAVAREQIRGQVAAVRNDVANQLSTFDSNMRSTIIAANESLTSVSASLTRVVGQMADCASEGSILGANNQCVNPMPTCPALNVDPGNGGYLRGDAVEAVAGVQETVVCPRPGTGPIPGVIQCLRSGRWSNTSAICQNCSSIDTGNRFTTCVECFNGRCLRTSLPGMSQDAPARDCLEIKQAIGDDATDGLYWVGRGRGAVWETYCSMSVRGGGWSLIASIHEDNVLRRDPDRSDRWTSAGNGIGSRAWQDDSTFGSARAATSGDYKNPGYRLTNGSNIMFWHVQNGSPVSEYKSNARYRYYTNNNVLAAQQGDVFAGIYAGQRAIQMSGRSCSGRLRTQIRWDTASTRNEFYDRQISPNFRNSHLGRDQMDFSSGTDSHCPQCIFAMCPGAACTRGCANHEHACIGGAMPYGNFRSDFTGMGWNGIMCPSCSGREWSAGGIYIRSAVLVFVR